MLQYLNLLQLKKSCAETENLHFGTTSPKTPTHETKKLPVSHGCPDSLQGNTLFISSADAAAVEIYSISGTLVKQATGNEIDLSALPAGVYVVRAAAAGSVVTEKICVR